MEDTTKEPCPACDQPYTEKEEIEANNIQEAFEKADQSRDPCVSSPKGTLKAFAYYHE